MDDIAGFLSLVSALRVNGNLVPQEDAEDLRRGATSIPSAVTSARREGKVVTFVQTGGRANWHWRIAGSNERIMYEE